MSSEQKTNKKDPREIDIMKEHNALQERIKKRSIEFNKALAKRQFNEKLF